jgi:methylenetetrahydrofolate dehydrogenase (NADP+)/methenyltetrahydrofolate cyclohydrolase
MILDGASLANEIKKELRKKVDAFNMRKISPKLSIILVGKDPASLIYTRKKIEACNEIGIETEFIEMPENTDELALINKLEELRIDSKIHGILVQLPLPGHINEKKILEAISEEKDVDGLNPLNLGRLLIGEDAFVPCTPKGIMRLLEHYKIFLDGKDVVIINRSNLLGKPLAYLLIQKNSTVTLCHSRTMNLKYHTRNADIVITGVGKPDFIDRDMIREEAVIVDVGICRKDQKVCGDTDFESLKDKASYITPVPGGVGPMTVAMVLENTLIAAERLTK